MPFRRVNSVKIGNELRNMAYSNILGQGFIAIIQGIVLGLGFWIFGIPDAFFWAIIGTFLSMIPLFGSPILFVPAGIIELSNGNVLVHCEKAQRRSPTIILAWMLTQGLRLGNSIMTLESGYDNGQGGWSEKFKKTREKWIGGNSCCLIQ